MKETVHAASQHGRSDPLLISVKKFSYLLKLVPRNFKKILNYVVWLSSELIIRLIKEGKRALTIVTMYASQKPIGLWSKVAHYTGRRVPFAMHTMYLP